MEFKHVPVMLNECIEGLNIKPAGIYLDGTMGGAGHSERIAERLTAGKLICLDKDADAIKFSTERLKDFGDRVIIRHTDFKDFESVLKELNIKELDGILLDLGVSSFQIDEASRGFSYMHDAPLDMRMDTSRGQTAADVVNNYDVDELTKIFRDYGEEQFARVIAKDIVKYREGKMLETTKELVDIIDKRIPEKLKYKNGHSAKRVFQALRIEVNGELDKLYECILAMAGKLKVGGRMAVLTFHSLEDRIVKNAFHLLSSDCICDKRLPVCVCHHHHEVVQITRKPLVATEAEMQANSRSKSAKLRIIEKV